MLGEARMTDKLSRFYQCHQCSSVVRLCFFVQSPRLSIPATPYSGSSLVKTAAITDKTPSRFCRDLLVFEEIRINPPFSRAIRLEDRHAYKDQRNDTDRNRAADCVSRMQQQQSQ